MSRWSVLLVLFTACALAATVHGQETIRPSTASAENMRYREEIRQRKELPAPEDPRYNVKLGPMRFWFEGFLRTEFNDNINLSDTDRKAEIIIQPGLNATGSWRLTRYNTLTLQMGLSYRKYLNNSELDGFENSLTLVPGTELAFNFKIGNFYFNVHDRPTIQHDPVDVITVTDVATFSRFTNTAGISVLWDVNSDTSVSFGYDHFDYVALDHEFNYLDHSSEQFFASTSTGVTEAISVGVESSLSFVNYRDNFQNDATLYSAGLASDVRISRYLKLRAAAGYQGGAFSSGGRSNDNSDLGTIYANFSLSQQINAYLNHSLSLGHEALLGTSTNFVEVTYLRYLWNAYIIRDVSLGGDAFVERADESGGEIGNQFYRAGVGLSLGYDISRQLRVNLRYQFTVRSADGELRDRVNDSEDYYQNRVALDFAYAF